MKKKETSIDIQVIEKGSFTCYVLGRSPLVLNAMSNKVKRELLSPHKKNAAEKASNLKHNPPVEFRDSAYKSRDDEAPTRIVFPTTAFKAALIDTAKDMPGAAKSQVGRLTWVETEQTAIYGVPQLWMSVVRMADIARTPDIRTRAILPQWACEITVTYVKPNLTEKAVASLLANAGLMRGIGDGRQEKGKFSFGQFELVSQDDKRWHEIVKTGGRVAQDAAFENPAPYDGETAELLAWWETEANRRGFKVVS